jgi:hypothetical protein
VGRRPQQLLLAVVAAVAATLALASTAQANFVATASDPAGDSTDPSPGRDIVGAGLAYDPRSGALAGGVALRGEPGDAPALIALYAGTQTATGCDGYPTAGFGSFSDEFGASWLRLDDAAGAGPRGDADKDGYRSEVQEFRVTDRQLAGRRLSCVMASLTEPGNAANVYDSVGPIALVGQPVLSLRIRGVPKRIPEGQSRTVKLVVANTGNARTRKVRLKIGRARGLKTTVKKRALKPIVPGRRRTVKVKVTLGARARTATDLKVTATAGKLVARAEETLYIRRKQSKPSPGGGGGQGGPQLCNRYSPDLTGETGGSLILVPC